MEALMSKPRRPGWPDIERTLRIICTIATEVAKMIWILRGER